jgi:formylglycine-generating enzyme required for sulfatase activity
MKLCPQCEKENPSSANHCMYCGTALVEEEQLSEEAKLLKKLKGQEEENRLLKAALDAQLKKEKEKPKEDVVNEQQSKISDKTQSSNSANKNIDTKKINTEHPKDGGDDKKNKYIVLFIILAIVACFILWFCFANSEKPATAYVKPADNVVVIDTVVVVKEPQKPTYTKIDIAMVYVKGGTFTMGCTSEQDSDCDDDEKPAHKVTLSDFYIGKYEVTQKQWRDVMGSNPSHFKDDDLPVENVSWNEVQDFIKNLNDKTGKNYRLPTEAEWEYAARGGASTGAATKYAGSNNLGDVAWCTNNSGSKTHAVGTKQANELGIYDMSGNVWEWCQDWCGDYSSSLQTNPLGPSSGSVRVLRGGSWGSKARRARVSKRNDDKPSGRDSSSGFRLAYDK